MIGAGGLLQAEYLGCQFSAEPEPSCHALMFTIQVWRAHYCAQSTAVSLDGEDMLPSEGVAQIVPATPRG